jgi:hypothetical protein
MFIWIILVVVALSAISKDGKKCLLPNRIIGPSENIWKKNTAPKKGNWMEYVISRYTVDGTWSKFYKN